MKQKMKFHYGTKGILACPMTRREYIDYRGWTLPADEDPTDNGFLVEHLNDSEQNHPDHQGYISWSPVGLFNEAYKPSGEMSFGHAIEAMKSGCKVARAGWNGKGMWVALTPGSSFDSINTKKGHAARHRANEFEEGGCVIHLLPHIDMRAADGSMVVGWLASQTDMLSDDWCIVP